MVETVVLSVMPSGEETARRVAAALSARLDLRAEYGAPVPHLQALFKVGHPIVFVGAAGIVIRALGRLLDDKWAEPPVIAVAEDGSAVLPLLGGHRGANSLAEEIAGVLGVRAAVTTAGELRLGVALDAPPDGWRLENPGDAKAVAAALLSGEAGRLSGEAAWLDCLDVERVPAGAEDPVVLSAGGHSLSYRRQDLILGLGAARGCDPAEMTALVQSVLLEEGLSPHRIRAVHSIDLKADEAAIHAIARNLDVPARFHTAEVLEQERSRLHHPSETVFREVGCHGVAEGAALAAAGLDGELCVSKKKSANATVAVAWSSGGGASGRARGCLSIVGIGPGDASWRTPEVTRIVAEADELVGYGLYIDLLGPESSGKARRDFALGEEEARCAYALERAGEGLNVALVCSGDGGIYAMGALVMELLARERVSDAARRVEIRHAPGISALQAASARAGAILGHDFCTISLSDLLTPVDDIRKRIRAAADGDFVIAFYNPVSKRRRTLLAEARDVLLGSRPGETPVVLASNLGRPEEHVRLRRLDALEVDEVDMLTVVVVGSSASRVVASGDRSAGAGGAWVFTPRGYAKKMGEVE